MSALPPESRHHFGAALIFALAQRQTHGGGKRRSGMLGSGGPLDPHDAQSGVKVYVDVYDQTFWPSGECAKVRHGFRSYGDTAFNLDSHVVAVAEKKFFHVLDCVGWVPHISFPKRTEATLCRSRCLRCLSGTLSSCGTKPAFRS